MVLLHLSYRLFAYCVFLAAFGAFPLFMVNIIADWGIDRPAQTGTALAVVIDVGLVALFGLQHTVMARSGFKRIIERVFPPALERSTFVLISSLCLALLMWRWQSLPGRIFSVTGPAAMVLHAINALGLAIVLAASFHLDHAALFGLKAEGGDALRTPGLYRFVRHPLMSGILVMLWVTPTMSVGRLLLASLLTLYIYVGTRFEERALLRRFGTEYQRYAESVGRFLPRVPPA